MINATKKTYMAKAETVQRKCYVIDAADKVLGRVATKAAVLLRGKHKVTYTPHVDTGDMVIIINASKIKVTGAKLTDKFYLRYSGYSSGQQRVALKDMLQNKPTKVLELAIFRMIPKGALGSKIQDKLFVYADDKHPHIAQKPVAIDI
ncbi:MAG: 50S ribosomal protein L13 [Candidatus Omnitrophica bacterium]|nr:50S ribosomal protein L13 [Candidatus Omnitrophota bacterium]